MKELQLSFHPETITVNQWTLEICSALFTNNIRSVKSYFLQPAVYQWLVQEGYAAAQSGTDGGQTGYLPTEKGSEHGLLGYEHTTEKGDTFARISCGEQGQRLLLDNVEQITALYQRWKDPLLACLTPEWRSQTWDLPDPPTATEVVKLINSRLPDDLPWKINRILLNDWLVWKGLLKEIAKKKGVTLRLPTMAGEKLGLHAATFSEKKWRTHVTWTAPAQQFVVDNFETIVRDLFSGEPYRSPRFVVTEEIQKGIQTVDDGIGSPALAELINAAIQKSGSDFTLTSKPINGYLLNEKYLVWEESSQWPSGRALVPTQLGQSIGLYLSVDGKWLKFGRNAQQFVVDNLQGIVDYYYRFQ